MSQNIIDRIWEEHVVSQTPGHPDIFSIDMHLMHEVTTPQAFAELRRRGIPLHDTLRCIATVDHNVSTAVDRTKAMTHASEMQLEALRQNCKDFGVRLFDMESGKQGIVHVIGPEQGITQPGMTMVCGDSHTSTHGAFGALAFGIGTTEISHVMATGCLLQHKPQTMKVVFKGRPEKGVTAKDLVLKLIQTVGVGGGAGYVMEYTGEAIRDMSMEGRMTICNMSIEAGARAGLVSPDETTFAYLRGRPAAPTGDAWDRAVEYWRSLASDKDAEYDTEVVVDIEGLAPLVTWGTNPAQCAAIDTVVPDPENLPLSQRSLAHSSLKYTQLKPGQPLDGIPVDYVFIGSCTNARLKDLQEAAEIFRGRTVAEGVTVYVVPGSELVRDQAREQGLDKIFEAAGAHFRNPGCSMCLAMNEDQVPEGKRCASTSNRNFVGRQGAGSITHLMSPIMAAAAAVTGQITDVRHFLD